MNKNIVSSGGCLESESTPGEVSVKLFAGVAELAGVKELRVSVKRFTVSEVLSLIHI